MFNDKHYFLQTNKQTKRTSIIRAKEPKNMEARKRRAEYILKEEEMKAECIAAGRDWNIEKLR